MANLYFTNSTSDSLWETLANWNTASDGSGSEPSEVPWTNTDGTTSAMDLVDVNGDGAILNSTIDAGVTGTCSISVQINSTINGGTFSANGSDLSASGIINGGIFSGNNFAISGTIYGGTFSGDNSSFSFAIINDGIFSGDGYFFTSTLIQNGEFSGSGYRFSWPSSQISGGVFSGDDFYVNGGGEFAGLYYVGGVFVYPAVKIGSYEGMQSVYIDGDSPLTFAFPSTGSGKKISLSQLLKLPFPINI